MGLDNYVKIYFYNSELYLLKYIIDHNILSIIIQSLMQLTHAMSQEA